MNWMLLPFKRYADFKGRSRRMEFWMYSLLNLLVWLVLGGVNLSSGNKMAELASAGDSNPLAVYGVMFSGPLGIVLAIWFLANIIPSIAVSVRRLHDRDMSGWWYLGFIAASFIPFVGFLASIAMLVIFCLKGTDGDNRFGPDPLKPMGRADIFA